MHKEITFKDDVLLVDTSGEYVNGRKAIELYEKESGEPYMTASVNIPMVPLAEDEIIIKDYSENEGIFAALVEAKIIESTGRTTPSGFVECPIGRLL